MHPSDPGRGWAARAAIACLLAVFAAQAWIAALRDSVTIDEFVHLPIGLYDLQTGDLSFDPINPPHTRMLAALPVLLEAPAFAPPPGARAGGSATPMHANAGRITSSSCRREPRSSRGRCCVRSGGARASSSTARPAGYRPFCSRHPITLAHGHLGDARGERPLGFTRRFAAWRLIDAHLKAALLNERGAGNRVAAELSGSCFSRPSSRCCVRALRERDRPCGSGGTCSPPRAHSRIVIHAGYGFIGTSRRSRGRWIPRVVRTLESRPWLPCLCLSFREA